MSKSVSHCCLSNECQHSNFKMISVVDVRVFSVVTRVVVLTQTTGNVEMDMCCVHVRRDNQRLRPHVLFRNIWSTVICSIPQHLSVNKVNIRTKLFWTHNGRTCPLRYITCAKASILYTGHFCQRKKIHKGIFVKVYLQTHTNTSDEHTCTIFQN